MRHLFALAAFLAFLAPAISHAEELARNDEIKLINDAARIAYASQETDDTCSQLGHNARACRAQRKGLKESIKLAEDLFKCHADLLHVDAQGREAIRAIGMRWAAEHPGYHDDAGFWTVPRAEF